MYPSSPDYIPSESEESVQPRIYTVSEITQDIQTILEAAFDTVWLEGEISNLRVAASKHAYFVLKDEKTQIRCVQFRGSRAGMKFQPEDGDQVLLFGRVTVYGARGEYQIIVETMEPRGLGALQKAFEQLKEKLDKEGLFHERHKKELPPVPWKIGVITSPTGAVVRDIIHVSRRRSRYVSILLNPVKVQGEGAAEEIAQAIVDMNRLDDIDILIVGRGGGSIEDLWAFNEEIVARAIHASRIPVISAVGHEVDFTIADFVADVRAPTPSAAAEIAVPLGSDLEQRVSDATRQMIDGMNEVVQDHRQTLKHFMDRRFFREPHRILEAPAQRLDEMGQRLMRGLASWRQVQTERLRNKIAQLIQASPTRLLQRNRDKLESFYGRLGQSLKSKAAMDRQRLTGKTTQLFQLSPGKQLPHLEERRANLNQKLVNEIQQTIRFRKESFVGNLKNLNALNPLAILERGYSICKSQKTGKALTQSKDAQSGDSVEIRLAKGSLECEVKKVKASQNKT